MLRKLFGRDKAPTAVSAPEAIDFSTKDFHLAIVGESHYQEALREVGGREPTGVEFSVLLLPDPKNPHDENAVRVDESGKRGATIGYLSRSDAEDVGDSIAALLMHKNQVVMCSAKIFGGGPEKPTLGVWLSLDVDALETGRPAEQLRARREPSRRSGSDGEHGLVQGRHWREWEDDVATLRRHGQDEKAESLLLEMLAAAEDESRQTAQPISTYCYRTLAILYRQRKDYQSESLILERYSAFPNTDAGARTHASLMQQLDKSRSRVRP